jgi:hypothetical protein
MRMKANSEDDSVNKNDAGNPDEQETAEAARDSGGSPATKPISPLDLVSLPRDRRRLLTWLARNRLATEEQIVDALAADSDEEELKTALEEFVDAGHIEIVDIEGENYFQCHVRGQSRRNMTSMSGDLWGRLDKPEDS